MLLCCPQEQGKLRRDLEEEKRARKRLEVLIRKSLKSMAVEPVVMVAAATTDMSTTWRNRRQFMSFSPARAGEYISPGIDLMKQRFLLCPSCRFNKWHYNVSEHLVLIGCGPVVTGRTGNDRNFLGWFPCLACRINTNQSYWDELQMIEHILCRIYARGRVGLLSPVAPEVHVLPMLRVPWWCLPEGDVLCQVDFRAPEHVLPPRKERNSHYIENE